MGWLGRLGLEMGLKGLAELSSPSLLFSKTENNKEEKKKEGGVGEEVGHADNFPELTRMCLFLEK